MKTYIVGGAVRDALLGLPVQDRDWVVVGGTVEAMLARGFTAVGKDFPVFLHPHTHEEYALARTERKSGHGYTGFVVHAAPDVSLEDDLLRRDLTINAMARGEDGALVDPYGGQRDLAAKVLRHVSPAFAEDPVRILRVARFAARFDGFEVAEETLTLMRQMVASGEADHLVPERVWQEISRGLMAPAAMRMIEVLDACGALARCLPEVVARRRIDPLLPGVLRCAVARDLPLAHRWALLVGHDVAAAESASARLKVPLPCRDQAVMLARDGETLSTASSAVARLELLSRCDAFRRPERLTTLLEAAPCAHPVPAAAVARWQATLAAAQSVDGGAVARQCADKSTIPVAIRGARLAAIEAADAAAGRG